MASLLHRWKLTENANDSAADGTVSLLHFDGDITDGSGRVWTAYGGATTSTTQKKFGSGALYLNGSSDYLTTPNNADFNFSTGDFTIDCWLYPTSINSLNAVFDKYDASNGTWQVAISSGKMNIYIRRATPLNYTSSLTSLTLNAWNHCAWVRNNGTIYLYLNGINVGSVSATDNLDSTCIVTIGRQGNQSSYYFPGYIDEMRVSKGIARWTSNFTPPAAPASPAGFGVPLNLTNNGSVTFSSDGASFNGSSQWLSGTLTCPEIVTLSMWFKSNNLGSGAECPIGFALSSSPYNQLGFGGNASNSNTYVYTGGNSYITLAGDWNVGNYPPTSFVHVLIVMDAFSSKLYRNGVLINDSLITRGAIATSFAIGQIGAYQPSYFNGLILDARIYDYAVSASEIAALAAAGPNPEKFQLSATIQVPTNYTYDINGEHIFTYDGSQYKYYQNGVLKVSSTNSPNIFPLSVISYYKTAKYVMAQSVAISASEARMRARGVVKNSTGQILYLKPELIDKNGVIRDLSGNGYTAQYKAAPIREVWA